MFIVRRSTASEFIRTRDGVDDGGGNVIGLAIIDGAKRLIKRVVKGGRSVDSAVDAPVDDAWDRAQAADIDQCLRRGRIEMLSAEESQEAIDALKKKWDMP